MDGIWNHVKNETHREFFFSNVVRIAEQLNNDTTNCSSTHLQNNQRNELKNPDAKDDLPCCYINFKTVDKIVAIASFMSIKKPKVR